MSHLFLFQVFLIQFHSKNNLRIDFVHLVKEYLEQHRPAESHRRLSLEQRQEKRHGDRERERIILHSYQARDGFLHSLLVPVAWAHRPRDRSLRTSFSASLSVSTNILRTRHTSSTLEKQRIAVFWRSLNRARAIGGYTI
jgi:hypothetical protein